MLFFIADYAMLPPLLLLLRFAAVYAIIYTFADFRY